MIQLLSSTAAWQGLRDHWDLDGAEAAEASASASAIELLLAAAADRNTGPRPANPIAVGTVHHRPKEHVHDHAHPGADTNPRNALALKGALVVWPVSAGGTEPSGDDAGDRLGVLAQPLGRWPSSHRMARPWTRDQAGTPWTPGRRWTRLRRPVVRLTYRR